jgi:hypothetical protein
VVILGASLATKGAGAGDPRRALRRAPRRAAASYRAL